MAGRSSKHSETPSDDELMHTLRAAAQQIWLAGLGALVRTQEEGGKVLGALKNGGRRGGRAAQDAGDNAARAAAQATRGASATLDRLEQMFETGISRTLERLGVPTAKEMRAIHDRLDALEGKGPARKQTSSARPATAAASGKKRAGAQARAKPGAKASAKTPAKKRAASRPRAAA